MTQVCEDPPRPRTGVVNRARVALVAGAVGVTAFLVVVAADGLTRTDGYDGTRHWISLLARGERAWLGTSGLVLAAVSVLVAAWGVRRAAPARLAPYLPLVVAGLGVSFAVAAVFPVDPTPSYPVGSPAVGLTAAGALHSLGGSTVLAMLALVAWTARRLGEDGSAGAAWRTASLGVVGLVAACPVGATLAVLVVGPSWEAARVGVFQRIAIGGGLVWFVVVLVALAVRDGGVEPA